MKLTPAEVALLAQAAGLTLDTGRAAFLAEPAAFLLDEARKLEAAGKEEEQTWATTDCRQA